MSLLNDLGLYVPREGPVDPDSCKVCSVLRQLAPLATEPREGIAVVQAMADHKTYGHPQDPR